MSCGAAALDEARALRVLQLTSDWKWTGPAEPMLQLSLGLRRRGEDVRLICPRAPEPGMRSVAEEARDVGLAPALELRRGRGVRILADRSDVRRLRAFLERERIQVVHTWHTRDHLLALRAAARLRRRGATALVRSYRTAEAIPRSPANRWLFGPGTDGLLCVSPRTARANQSIRGGRPIRGAFGAVDTERFAPRPADPAIRARLGLPGSARVVGIVARAQRHRRFELLLEAARRLFREEPDTRLLIIGRGTHRVSVAEGPARRLGIADRVVFGGYRQADYAEALRAIDVFTFLVPGSDGTCRALIEACACGIPAVTSRRGALPEIVRDGETGLLVDEDADALVRGWRTLLGDEGRRRALGAAARRRAETHFTGERLAEHTRALYGEASRAVQRSR